jgi:hypothetical protein
MLASAPNPSSAPATFNMMSDDFGKIAAISNVGLQGRRVTLHIFYHSKSIYATGGKFLV